MFAGHFAVGLALKARFRSVPLLLILLVVLLHDWIWIALSFAGVEHFRLVFPAAQSFAIELYDVPYSHSLFWALFYAIIVFLLFVKAEGQRHWAGPLGIAALSHWPLDFLASSPQLPFANFGPALKFGLGLTPSFSILLELLIVFIGWRYYHRQIKTENSQPRWASWVILALLAALSFYPAILYLFV